MKQDLLSACRNGVVVCDGGMGTQLMARGLKPGECGMKWNVLRPDDVRAVHAAYAAAGCQLITTNSFCGSRSMLARHGEDAHVVEWNRLAAGLARQAIGDGGWVLGDVGPFGEFLEPTGDATEDDLRTIFREQIAALVEGGADAILIETMSDPAEVAVAIRTAHELCNLPVIASFAFQKAGKDFRTMMGPTAGDAIAHALEAGADIVGANCGTDLSLDDYVELAGQLVSAAGSAPVILQPNAGAPKSGPEGFYYDATGDEMAATALRLREAGVRMIGGCCGTSPELLNHMVRALA